MMAYLVISLLVLFSISSMAAPVKSVKTSNHYSSNDNDRNPDEEYKQVINNIKENEEKFSTLASRIEEISKLSRNNYNKGNYQSLKLEKNKYPTPLKDFQDTPPNFYAKKMYDSKIFYVRLPPAPYFYVPGLGYISNPPKFSSSSLEHFKINKQNRPVQHYQTNSFINLPIDFVSNGKPTSVYRWKKPFKAKRESSIIKLKKGPYQFNGKPTALYLFGSNGQATAHQTIRYPDLHPVSQ